MRYILTLCNYIIFFPLFSFCQVSKNTDSLSGKKIIDTVINEVRIGPCDSVLFNNFDLSDNYILKIAVNDSIVFNSKVNKSLNISVFSDSVLVSNLFYTNKILLEKLLVTSVNPFQSAAFNTLIRLEQGFIPKVIYSARKDNSGIKKNILNYYNFRDYTYALNFIKVYNDDGKSYEIRSYFDTGELEFKTTFNMLDEEIGPRIRYSKTKGIISIKTKGFTYKNYEEFIYSTSEYNRKQK